MKGREGITEVAIEVCVEGREEVSWFWRGRF